VGVRARDQRREDRARLLRALRREGLWPGEQGMPEYSAELARAVHVYLARSAAALVTVQLEDMTGMLEPVNIPGTSTEYPNWTRRMTASAADIFARPDVRALAAAITEARRER
jgi:4-alpha-glucanotransferase